MEKTYQVKLIDALYYDGKILPVQLTTIKGKKYISFIGSKSKLEVVEIHDNIETYNQDAQSILLLKTVHNETRYAELGTLTSVLCNTKKDVVKKFPKLYAFKSVLENNENAVELESSVVGNYFDVELTTEEIKDIFNAFNKKAKKVVEMEK